MHRVVPELIIENYRAGYFSGEFPAVGMFLDLSGFSTMTDTLMQHGQHGAEVLASLMHGVFNPLVESIFEFGGKIVSFAGDGIMALYPVEKDERSTALRALASAWVVQQRLMENPDRRTMYGKFTFSAKIGLASGSVIWQILRSKDGENATYYFRGSAVDDSANAEHKANAGEIILTQGITELLGEDVRTRPSESFFRFIRFRVEMPKKTTSEFPPVDLNISRIFMPEEVIVDGVRGEFRQIVNLFIRIPDLPDAELKSFVNVIFDLQKKYGGLVTRLDFGDKGCNMLMLWGAPRTYENDIGRALNFVLGLRSIVNIPITAGVTYYIAHAGYLGSELCEDYTCYGWGVNLASRFMMSAPTGEIWVDDRVAQRVSRRFAMEYVGSQRFKGFAAEQKVHVLQYRKMESDVIYHGKMVGRDGELKQMQNFVEPLWQGNFAGVLTIMGDAGIGKGRLVHEFAASELFDPHTVYWANCKTDQILRQSFNPLRGWLLRYFRSQPNQSMNERKLAFDSKMDGLLDSIQDTELRHELDRTRSFLGALLDLHWDDSLYEKLDAEARYNNTILSLIALIKAESLRQPVILFLDDVQFLDQDSIEFLVQFKRSLLSDKKSHAIAFILTVRTQGENLPIVNELSDAEIILGNMTQSILAKLAENILGGPVSPELMKLISYRSEGNPYFAEQVVRYLKEEQQLEAGEKGWIRVERARDSVLPGDIRALLVARLDKLPREVKNAVHTASVLGREFDFGVLAQMLGSEVTTREHVNEAEKAIIWSPINEIRYIFQHGLLRDAAYTIQMRARRQELHILALNALEIIFEDEPDRHYAEWAYHAEQGEARSKAQRYYTLAAQASAEKFQNNEAVEYFTKALAFTEFDDLETQFDLLAERVELYSRMGKRDLQLNDLYSLEQWANQLKDNDYLAKVMLMRSTYSFLIGNYQEAINYAERAGNTSENISNSDLALYAQAVWAVALLHLGRLDEAMAHAQKTLERIRKLGNRKEEGRILNSMGWIALEQNKAALARGYFTEGLEIAHEIGDPALECRVLNHLAKLEGEVEGDFSFAREYYEKSYKLAHDIGDRTMETIALVNMGFAAGMQGDIEAALIYHGQSLILAREMNDVNLEINILVNLSAISGIQGSMELALQHAQSAMDLAKKISDPFGEAWATLYLGHALSAQRDYDQARVSYQRSVEIRLDHKQLALAMEPISGLLETYLLTGELELATLEADKILQFIENGSTLDGADEPLRVYYNCYNYLKKTNDPRANQILNTARNLLNAQVTKFSKETDRNRYIENNPWRRAVQDAT